MTTTRSWLQITTPIVDLIPPKPKPLTPSFFVSPQTPFLSQTLPLSHRSFAHLSSVFLEISSVLSSFSLFSHLAMVLLLIFSPSSVWVVFLQELVILCYYSCWLIYVHINAVIPRIWWNWKPSGAMVCGGGAAVVRHQRGRKRWTKGIREERGKERYNLNKDLRS